MGNSGHTWVDEEKVATSWTALLYDLHLLAWSVTDTATSSNYNLTVSQR